MADEILILGGTGKTGARLARTLRDAGEPVRTAARSGADVHFDWNDPETHDAALAGAGRVYLVPPALRLDAAPDVSALLDRAAAAGVRHVTALSAHGVEHAPPEAMLRAIELDLADRGAFGHTILRPAWFMQNLSEGFLEPGITGDGVLAVPAGDGAEAFVDADDIAAVAAATLRDPDRHAGEAYALTGPAALTHTGLAERIAAATGRAVRYVDAERTEWVEGAIASGVPSDYAALLAALLDVIRDGHGARPTDDVERVTGRPARAFERFAAEAVAAGVWRAPAREAA